MRDKLIHTQQVISAVAQKSRRAGLFFSGGKDSIALLDLMAPHFDEITAVFMYLVKGLSHIDRYLTWAGHYPNVRVLQVPHWNLSHIRQYGIFCKPDPSIRILKLADIDQAVRERTGIDHTFYGFKMADSLNRRLMLRRFPDLATGPNGKVYPLSTWLSGEVLEYISTRNLPQPVQYSAKQSHGVGFTLECFLYLQEHYPADLQMILNEFPAAEKILIDHARQKEAA